MSEMTAVILVFAWMANGTAPERLSEGERRAMRDAIIAQQAKISSLYVKFRSITRRNVEEPNERRYEWAMSGEKRYRKSFWPGPVGGPVPARWGLVVWDGRFKKAYDSATNNGSLRNEDDPHGDGPQTWSPYCRSLGDLSGGLMTQIFAQVPLEDWEAQWSEDRKTVTFTTDDFPGPNSSLEHRWTFDTTRGYTISKSQLRRKDAEGQWRTYLSFAVIESKEVSPGIWVAVNSHSEALWHLRGEDIRNAEDCIVDEIVVNDPKIESLFHFDWPPDAMYYDYIHGRSANPRLDAIDTAWVTAWWIVGILAGAGLLLMSRKWLRRHRDKGI